ncbi:hypothetical protein WN48_02379 [Eufriesea mexicana]|nr:hypothetical protein WN48_02379 [Eufriesea mexicana]
MKLLVSTRGPCWAVAGQDRHFASQPHGVELNHPCGLTVDGTSPSASMCPSPSRVRLRQRTAPSRSEDALIRGGHPGTRCMTRLTVTGNECRRRVELERSYTLSTPGGSSPVCCPPCSPPPAPAAYISSARASSRRLGAGSGIGGPPSPERDPLARLLRFLKSFYKELGTRDPPHLPAWASPLPLGTLCPAHFQPHLQLLHKGEQEHRLENIKPDQIFAPVRLCTVEFPRNPNIPQRQIGSGRYSDKKWTGLNRKYADTDGNERKRGKTNRTRRFNNAARVDRDAGHISVDFRRKSNGEKEQTWENWLQSGAIFQRFANSFLFGLCSWSSADIEVGVAFWLPRLERATRIARLKTKWARGWMEHDEQEAG